MKTLRYVNGIAEPDSMDYPGRDAGFMFVGTEPDFHWLVNWFDFDTTIHSAWRGTYTVLFVLSHPERIIATEDVRAMREVLYDWMPVNVLPTVVAVG